VLATGPRGEPVTLDPDARVRLRLRGTQGPWLTLGRGALVGELPALEGELELGVEGGGRALSRPTHVKLTGAKAGLEAEPTRVSLTLDEPSSLDVQVRLGPGPAGPARVVVTSDATGALALDAATDEAGRLARPLQPGIYRVLAHRGARFSLAVAKVTLGAGQTRRLELDLVRERDDAPLACDLLGDAALGDERLLREAASRGLACAAPLGSPPRPPSSEPARASAGRWYTTRLPSPLVVSEGAAPDLPALLDGGALAAHAGHGAPGAHGALAAPAPRALSGSSEAPLDLAGRLELVRAASLATAPPGEASALSGLLALVTPEARGRAGGDPSAALAASALSNGPALDVHVRRGNETSRERFTLDGRAELFVTGETASWLPLESLSIHADGALVARVPARTEKTATGSLRVTWRFPLRRWTAKGTTPAPRALGPVVQRGRDASDGLEWLEGPTLSLPKGARLVVVAEGPVVSRPHFAGRPVAVSAPLMGER
jgi:hypothetical protein